MQLPDVEAVERHLAHASQLQQQIWSNAITASAADPTQNVARLLLPALNDMVDVTTARTIALHTHLPPLIFGLSIIVALLSALRSAGYDAVAKRRKRKFVAWSSVRRGHRAHRFYFS